MILLKNQEVEQCKEKHNEEFTPWLVGLMTGVWLVAALWAMFG